ncbi:secretion protein EspD [Mycobacterium aquaticum]|uniref:Secretion protein EspD n=1 Tax=Mycobacterium aquaticum TaxID=1927124 RepID=A0A1X0B2A6_9MYCO|nr:secretion protein EspD [Mycobacterium aquaticum]ORA36319.1 secretion protein EspD [Mycobacterium aquaticum]
MGESPPYDRDYEDDDQDILSAIDFAYPDQQADDDSDLDVHIGAPAASDDAEPAFSALDVDDVESDEPDVPIFSVTNPPGTVTVTAYMDGRVQQIDLSPKAVNMTESDLIDEILVIAELATQDARSAQYSFMLQGMREQGHDDFATRDFLTRDLNLPTPEQSDAARAQIFATRYGGENG